MRRLTLAITFSGSVDRSVFLEKLTPNMVLNLLPTQHSPSGSAGLPLPFLETRSQSGIAAEACMYGLALSPPKVYDQNAIGK